MADWREDLMGSVKPAGGLGRPFKPVIGPTFAMGGGVPKVPGDGGDGGGDGDDGADGADAAKEARLQFNMVMNRVGLPPLSNDQQPPPAQFVADILQSRTGSSGVFPNALPAPELGSPEGGLTVASDDDLRVSLEASLRELAGTEMTHLASTATGPAPGIYATLSPEGTQRFAKNLADLVKEWNRIRNILQNARAPFAQLALWNAAVGRLKGILTNERAWLKARGNLAKAGQGKLDMVEKLEDLLDRLESEDDELLDRIEEIADDVEAAFGGAIKGLESELGREDSEFEPLPSISNFRRGAGAGLEKVDWPDPEASGLDKLKESNAALAQKIEAVLNLKRTALSQLPTDELSPKIDFAFSGVDLEVRDMKDPEGEDLPAADARKKLRILRPLHRALKALAVKAEKAKDKRRNDVDLVDRGLQIVQGVREALKR